jgi:hypothetical protein
LNFNFDRDNRNERHYPESEANPVKSVANPVKSVLEPLTSSLVLSAFAGFSALIVRKKQH